MKLRTFLIAGAALAAISGTAAARDNVSFSISFGVPAPILAAPAPVYVAPAPVYYPPAPVYAPAPAYYYYPPRVVYAAPPRVVYAPRVHFGYRGHWRERDRQEHGRRWGR